MPNWMLAKRVFRDTMTTPTLPPRFTLSSPKKSICMQLEIKKINSGRSTFLQPKKSQHSHKSISWHSQSSNDPAKSCDDKVKVLCWGQPILKINDRELGCCLLELLISVIPAVWKSLIWVVAQFGMSAQWQAPAECLKSGFAQGRWICQGAFLEVWMFSSTH